MTVAEKKLKIAAFLHGALAFEDVLSFDTELLQFRPEPGIWSIQEQVVHVLESEVTSFHRYRKAIAEPGGAVVGYDEEKFTPILDYHQANLGDCLATFRLLRKMAARHLLTLVERDWTALAYQHNINGLVNLETWIDGYIGHVADHRALVDRNIRLWKNKSA